MEFKKTERGFSYAEFTDRYGAICQIQKSSLASESAIWFGIKDAEPQILASKALENGVNTDQTTGWIPYPLPDDVLLSTRMHLTQQQVAALLPTLTHFAETGELL